MSQVNRLSFDTARLCRAEISFTGKLFQLNQKSFEQYLTKGNTENFAKPLDELSNNEFIVLEKIVNEWSSFQIGFESFYSERVKRFNRYG